MAAQTALEGRHHEFPQVFRQSFQLPLAFGLERFALGFDRFSSVDYHSQAMFSHVGGSDRVTGRSSRRDGSLVLCLAGGRVCSHRRLLGAAYWNFAPRPRSAGFNRPARSIIRTMRGKNPQQMFGAIRRPFGQQMMFLPIERATPMHRHKTPVTHAILCLTERRSHRNRFIAAV
jgi:hypothetical protein